MWEIKLVDNEPSYYLFHCYIDQNTKVKLAIETGFYDSHEGYKTRDSIICKGCNKEAPKKIIMQLRLLRGR